MESAKIVQWRDKQEDCCIGKRTAAHYVQKTENGVLHLSKIAVESVDVDVRNGNGITEAVKEDDDERKEYLMTQVNDLPCVTHCLQHLDHLGLSSGRLDLLLS